MAETIGGVIPVAPTEPLDIIERSVDCMRGLDAPDGYTFTCTYVIDTEDAETDERVAFLREEADDRIGVVVREPGIGRRAAAINRGLDEIPDAAYVAVFDIDTRVDPDFLATALDRFGDDTVFVTGPRTIINAEDSLVTRTVDTEFTFFRDMQVLLGDGGGFTHANGLIGVLDGPYFQENRMHTGLQCADTDFSERAYADGKRTVIDDAVVVREQAVTNAGDLYRQTVRWMGGAVEGLRDHARPMLAGRGIPLRVRVTWLAALLLPFFAALFSPLAAVYALLRFGRRPVEAVRRIPGAFLFCWLVSLAGLVALWKMGTGRGIGWETPDRDAA